MNLKGRINHSTAWQDVLAHAFASATICDGYCGHSKDVFLSSVDNYLAVVDKETGSYFLDRNVTGLDQAEILWRIKHDPSSIARDIYKSIKLLSEIESTTKERKQEVLHA